MLVALLCTIYCGIPQLDTLSTIAWPRTPSAMVRAARASACLYHIAMLFPENLLLSPLSQSPHLPTYPSPIPHPMPSRSPPFPPSTFFHVLSSMCFPPPQPFHQPDPSHPIPATYLPSVLLSSYCR